MRSAGRACTGFVKVGLTGKYCPAFPGPRVLELRKRERQNPYGTLLLP